MSEANGWPWESDGNLPWEISPDEDTDEIELGGWRGCAHLPDWPEHLAGPEYWLYKNLDDPEAA